MNRKRLIGLLTEYAGYLRADFFADVPDGTEDEFNDYLQGLYDHDDEDAPDSEDDRALWRFLEAHSEMPFMEIAMTCVMDHFERTETIVPEYIESTSGKYAYTREDVYAINAVLVASQMAYLLHKQPHDTEGTPS